jgi:hypothetical protein
MVAKGAECRIVGRHGVVGEIAPYDLHQPTRKIPARSYAGETLGHLLLADLTGALCLTPENRQFCCSAEDARLVPLVALGHCSKIHDAGITPDVDARASDASWLADTAVGDRHRWGGGAYGTKGRPLSPRCIRYDHCRLTRVGQPVRGEL